MDDHLRRPIALAGDRIDGGHPKSDRLTALETAVEEAVARVARRVEVDDVTVNDQAGGLPGERRRSERRDEHESDESHPLLHAALGSLFRWLCPVCSCVPLFLLRRLFRIVRSRVRWSPSADGPIPF